MNGVILLIKYDDLRNLNGVYVVVIVGNRISDWIVGEIVDRRRMVSRSVAERRSRAAFNERRRLFGTRNH